MGVRDGAQYLAHLRGTSREIWLGGERVDSVVDHPALRDAALAIAAYYDLHHRNPDEMLTTDPIDGSPMALSHIEPRSIDDLRRRRGALTMAAELSMGTMGRTPDYMNVTFAGFAADRTRWSGIDESNAEGYANLVAFQRRLRTEDLALTHTIVHPTIDRQSDAEFVTNPVPLHKVGETSDSIVVRGARLLATLAPFADEQAVYPGSPLPPGSSPDYALAFSIPMDTPGLVFLCRDSASRPGARPFDAPFSTRFDEQDAYCIFDDVEVPKDRVFINGDLGAYNQVMGFSAWWPNIMHQTTVRALTKMEFAYGLATRMAEIVNDVSERTLEMLGEVHSYVEMTRSAIVVAEDHAVTWEDGAVFPDARALHPMRSMLPVWFARINEILRMIGSHNLLATGSRAQLDDPRIGPLLHEFLPGANGVTAEDRAAVFRLAWDFIGSVFGARNELYELNYLASTRSNRMNTHRLYADETRRRGADLVARALADARHRA